MEENYGGGQGSQRGVKPANIEKKKKKKNGFLILNSKEAFNIKISL